MERVRITGPRQPVGDVHLKVPSHFLLLTNCTVLLSLSLDAVFANQIRVTLSLFTTYLVKALSGSIITPEET